MKRLPYPGLALLIFVVCLLLAPGWMQPQATATAAPLSPQEAVEQAWELAQASGAFTYRTTVEQTVYPAPAVANAGRPPTVDRLGIAGSVDLAGRTLDMTFWQDASFDPNRGVEVRVEGDRAYARLNGAEWQEIDNVADLFAPTGDPLAFLAAATNIQRGETRTYDFGQAEESQVEITYTEYTFALDGPAFAEYIRRQTEQLLREQNRLPQTISLSAPDHYRRMTGSGRLWLEEATGLPARLAIELEMPVASGERLAAELTNDYSDFNHQQLQRAAVTLQNNPTRWFQQQAELLAQPQTWRNVALAVSGLLLLTAIILLIIRYWNTRQLYRVIISGVIFGVVIVPLLNANEVAAFYQEQQHQAAAQEARQAEAQQMAQEAARPTWNPQQSPLQAPRVAAPGQQAPLLAVPDRIPNLSGVTTDSDGDQLSDTDEAFWDSCPYLVGTPEYTNEPDCENVADPTDSDDDTLSDYVEVYQLHTLPNADDTDGDTILDQFEITGFDYNGQHWYLNPAEPDTNGDGRLDSLECPLWSTSMADYDPNTICPDTDNDGRPDLFDIDDDDDGMDDVDDASPVTVPDRTFDGDNPLELKIDNLQTGQPVLMTLQFRPTAADNLNYNGHVLNWPTGDTEGQIQRRLDTTFYTTQNSEVQSNDPRADFGDVRVVPMLEIIMPYSDGHYANLPVKDGAPAERAPGAPVSEWLDAAQLERYGVQINDLDDGSGDLHAYLPLNNVNSSNGQEVIAFQANMLYWPSQGATADPSLVDWAVPHQFRVAWLVQMLTDECINPTDDPDTCQRQDTVQVIQIYYDEWELTSLLITEEHGLDVAILYENPANDLNINVDGELWLASWNLGNTFLRGRDCDSLINDQCSSDGQRDVTVQNIEAKLDEWSGNTSAVDVATFNYPHSDMLPNIMVTETNAILNTVFSGYETQTYPTFLFMQENRSRTAGLGDGSAFNGNQLAIDFANAGLINMGFLSWDSYQYNTATQTWSNFNPRDYLTYLDWQLQQDPFFQPADESLDSQATSEGKRIWAQVYYLTLRRGISAWQEYNDQLMWENDDDIDESAFAEYQYILSGSGEISAVAGNYLSSVPSGLWAKVKGIFTGNKVTFWQAVRDSFNSKVSRYTVSFKEAYYTIIGSNKQEILGKEVSPYTRSTLGVIVVGVGLIAAGITLHYTTDSKGGQVAADVLTKTGAAILLATDTYFTTAQMAKIIVEARKIVFFSSAIGAANKLMNKLRVSAAVGFVLTVLMQFGIFFAFWAAGEIGPNKLAFWFALATVIAVIIIEAVFFLIQLALPIIGTILVLLIQIADFIASLFNASFIMALAEEMATWIYDIDIIIGNLGDSGRLDIDILGSTLLNPDDGFTVSNGLTVTVGVTNTLRFRDSASDSDARRATFRYFLETSDASQHSGIELNQMNSAWESLPGHYIRVSDVVTQVVNFADVGAGINRNLDGTLYLIEAYAAPVEGCFTYSSIEYGCKYFTTPASNPINLGETIVYDILPDTITEFIALNWNYSFNSSLPFPPQVDRDADGLANVAAGGADPNDLDDDSDGDGLTDYYEITYGLDPGAADADLDSLNDKEELILGTNPFQGDSDGDGLNDYVETIEGWLVPYDSGSGVAYARVWSNPWLADEDFDSLSDLEEFVFGQHPQIETDPSVIENLVQINNLDLDEDNGVVLFGQFEESPSAEVFADSSGKQHPFFCERAAGHCPTAGENGRYGSALSFDGVDDYLSVPFLVNPGVDSLTAAAWFKLTGDYGSGRTILQQNNGNGAGRTWLNVNAVGQLSTSLGNVLNFVTVTTNEWHHAAVTYDGATVTLYLDGQSLGNVAATPPASEGTMLVGVNKGFADYFVGPLDEVVVLDRALSASEVQALMNGRINPNDLFVTPGATLTYRATITNTSPTQAVNGFIAADTAYLTPTVAYPAVALSYEPEDQINTFTNWVGESSTATCLGDGGCPLTGVGGRYGSAVHFTEPQDSVILPSMGGTFDEYAVAFWLNLDALPPAGQTMSILDTERTDDGALDISINDAGNLVFQVAGQAPLVTSYSLAANLGAWQHFVYSFRDYTDTVAYVYRNTNQISVQNFGSSISILVGPGRIGNNMAGSAALQGRLDELVFYNNDAIDKSNSFGDPIEVISVYNGVYNTHQDGWYDFTQPAFLLKFDEVASNYNGLYFPDSTSTYTATCDAADLCPSRTAAGFSGYAVNFDGVNDTILTPFNDTERNVSAVFYINPDSYPSAGNTATILDSQGVGAIDIFMDETGRLGVVREGVTALTSVGNSLPLNTWTKVSVVIARGYSGTYYYRLGIFFNDVQVGTYSYCSGSTCTNLTSTIGPGRIGARLDGQALFDGSLDQFVLTASTLLLPPRSPLTPSTLNRPPSAILITPAIPNRQTASPLTTVPPWTTPASSARPSPWTAWTIISPWGR
ncbi:MAG: hypothetical protein L0332_24790 [Chloroflexi bacterium]|nr:hypothetical protein [Chloroflexota bacterium]MCI0576881.1 hypothetical protein [Chloroflexota bacterium]MCI0646465.1 hypothetical protein [Chloroflexota bacterium]MCI0729914.1 hypothetical protein [Chloroflexota bacterium]